jgi:pimeloyl-ACP methyl ester carboxylesterase
MRYRLTLLGLVLLLSAPVLGAQESTDTSATLAPAPARELVVVLHGMGRTARSMRPMEEALEAAGFDVLNIGYSSYCCSIPELGEAVRRELDAKRKPEHARVHFVGHSLGNIIARWIVSQPEPPLGVARLVMLAPPNQGSRMADRFAPMVGWLLEPIDELRTDSAATVRLLAPLSGVEIGVIAGRDDSTVRLEETHLAGETAHVVVKGNHTFIMREREVQQLTVEFLRTGRFSEPVAAVR